MPFFQKRSDRGKGRGGGGAYQGQGGRGGGRGGWAPGSGAEGGGISRSRPRGPSPEDEELERSLGFGTFTEGDTRLGWLMNMSPVRNTGLEHDITIQAQSCLHAFGSTAAISVRPNRDVAFIWDLQILIIQCFAALFFSLLLLLS